MRGWHTAKANSIGLLAAEKKADGTDVYAEIGALASKDGSTYGYSPNPPSTHYSNSIATTKFVKDYAPEKLSKSLNIYVDEVNGSDTADLFRGRGLTEDKPFATLPAALNYVRLNYYLFTDYVVQVILLSDVVATHIYATAGARIRIISIGEKKTIHFVDNSNRPDPVVIQGFSAITFDNVILDFSERTLTPTYADILIRGMYDGIPAVQILHCNIILSSIVGKNGLCVMGGAIMNIYDCAISSNSQKSSIIYVLSSGNAYVSGVTFNTTAERTIMAYDGGTVLDCGNLTGTAIGKRYTGLYGGRILTKGLGPNAITGTIDGTCDATSIYS